MDDAKFRRDNVKEIISTLVDNEVDLSQNKYDHFKEIEDKVEKGFKIARLNIKMKLINYLHWVLILMIIKIVQFFDFSTSEYRKQTMTNISIFT